MLLEYVVESQPVTNNTNPLKHSKTLEKKVSKLRKTQKLKPISAERNNHHNIDVLNSEIKLEVLSNPNLIIHNSKKKFL